MKAFFILYSMQHLNQNEYSEYYGYYISLNDSDDLILNLENQLEVTCNFLIHYLLLNWNINTK